MVFFKFNEEDVFMYSSQYQLAKSKKNNNNKIYLLIIVVKQKKKNSHRFNVNSVKLNCKYKRKTQSEDTQRERGKNILS